MSTDLSGQIAIVTGASSGIGAATAELLASCGACVVASGRNVDRTQATANRITAAGGTAVAHPCDLTEPEAADGLVAAAAALGDLRIVANIAGLNHRADAIRTSDDDWARIMGTNVDAVFRVSRAAVQAMSNHDASGCIINLGSTVGSVGTAGMTAYCVSKGAVHQLTRAMALDHAADDIRVNAVCPGAVDTPMLASGHSEEVTHADVIANNVASIPQRRVPAAHEIAEVIAFLASNAAAHITGALIPVDGGYTAQ